MRWQHVAGRLATSLAAITLVAGCGAGAASPDIMASAPVTSETASTAAAPDPARTPAPNPTPVTTPAGATRPPGTADLVVRLTWDSDVVVPIAGTTILDDGRVVWMDDTGAGTIVERRLTAAGLAWIRERLDETALLRANGGYGATLKPGAQPDARGVTAYLLRLESGATRLKVAAGDPGDYDPARWDIPPEMQVLADLAHHLQTPESWVDPAMWAGVATPFRPHAYLVIVDLGVGPPAFGRYPNDIDDVDWPFQVAVTDVGSPYLLGGGLVPDRRCLVATPELARSMAEAEAALGHQRALDGWDMDQGYRVDADAGNVVITTRPLLPYQTGDCSSALAW